ncbi:MAG: DegT/DnrJ/EryC1/StrS family aminotransferase [Candidatus Omnitrophota bacterium]
MKAINLDKKSEIFFEPYHYASRADIFEKCDGEKLPSVEDYFEEFFGRKVMITINGRMAISLILRSLDLKIDDEIYITTTFEKPNVSSCVTSTIFNFCRPSRVLTDKTKAIFLIHEFGVVHPRIHKLRLIADARNIPLIEDCAHTINSRSNGKAVGASGDFVVCSFPKIYPIQYGGLLIGMNTSYKPTLVQSAIIEKIRNILPKYMRLTNEYSQKRRDNFQFLAVKFKELLLLPFHQIDKDVSPSLFFPLVTDRYEEVMEKASNSKIENALWHGTNIVVLPVHQFLVEEELERIFQVVKSVYEKNHSESVCR